MLKLKLRYFGHLMQRADSLKIPWCWERLKAGGEGDDRGWDSWMASPTQWIWVWVGSRSWWWTGRPDVLQSMGSQSQTWLSDWTGLNWTWIGTDTLVVLFFNLGFQFLLSVYRKAIDFYVLMYSVILLNSLISTRSFVSVFLRLSQILWDFLHRQSSHLQINTVLFLPF